MPKLVLKNISLHRQQACVLKPFSAYFNAGEIIAVVGNNGSGKSTLLQTLAGLRKDAGQIYFDDKDSQHLSRLALAQKLSLLMQSSIVHPYALAYNRIAQGLMPHVGFCSTPDQQSSQLIEESAHKLKITHLLNKPLARMSGGEQRLVNIAKCLVNPRISIILLDEPSVYLDFSQAANLRKNLIEKAQLGALVIFASHDRELIEHCATKVLFIEQQCASIHSPAAFFSSFNREGVNPIFCSSPMIDKLHPDIRRF